ncbi:cytochrome P450 [Microbacterium sp. NPDC077644]|uniref:cytochrome P450 n=1 Tax=Microbacterium sp. NPDC077644 TaxID=3155055 RepID=UPI00344EB974
MTTSSTSPQERVFSDIDISSNEFWAKSFDEREKSFAELRSRGGVTWHPSVEVSFPHAEPGFWAITQAEQINEISLDHESFITDPGVNVEPIPYALSKSLTFLLQIDQPEHTLLRGLVSAAFTPKQVLKIQDQIFGNAAEIVDRVVGAGEIDFASQIAGVLPMRTVSDMVGVSVADREAVATAAERLIGRSDSATGNPADVLQGMIDARDFLHSVGSSLAAHRRRNPADDLMTNLVEARIDGVGLSDDQIGSFMVLFAVAGNDTTKQTTSRTIYSLDRNRDQRDWLLEDYDGRIAVSIEEFVRHGSPVIGFARTATRDYELGGEIIRSGDKVVLFYCSGNRDGQRFADPSRFLLSRKPNRHFGFGGGGVHFCLGNGVAKTQLKALFGQLLSKAPDIEVGEPEALISRSINGIKRLPVRI